MIEKIELPETTLIIGENFPTKSEDAYQREAAKHKLIAGEVVPGIQAAVQNSLNYTAAQFRGQAGSGLADNLNIRQETHAEDLQLHHNLGEWYELGAQNIIQTKNAMNEACRGYHANYEDAHRRAVDEGWPQTRLVHTKAELVTQAQHEIQALEASYTARHAEISAGIVAGSAPTGGYSRDTAAGDTAGTPGRIDKLTGPGFTEGPTASTDTSQEPAQVRPSFPPGVRPDGPVGQVPPIEHVQSGIAEGPTFVDGQSGAAQIRPSFPPGVSSDEPTDPGPAPVRPA